MRTIWRGHRAGRPVFRGVVRGLVTACALSFAGIAVAYAGVTPADLTDLTLDELAEVEVVYAASRFDQPLADVPASVTIVTAEEIRAHGYRTVAEVLHAVRSFTVTSDRNYEYLGVRGFSRLGDYNTHLLLLVDGHRLNDNVYDQAVIGLEVPLDLSLVSRVEIVRGPGSSVYGSSAVLGVVNLVTRRPAELPRLESDALIGSLGERAGAFRWTGPLGPGAGLDVAVSGGDSRGADLAFPGFDGPGSTAGSVGLDRERVEKAYARVDWRGLRVQAFQGFRVKGIPTGSFGTLLDDERNQTRDDYRIVQGSYAWEAGGLDLSARGTYQEHGYYGDYVYDYGDPGAPAPAVYRDAGVGRWWDATLTARRAPSRRHQLAGGLEFRHDLQVDQWALDPYVVYVDDHRTLRTWSAFVQDRLQVGRGLALQLDLRHDRYDDFGGQTNPRVAAVWSADRNASVKAIFGRAYRVPNPYERFYESDVVRVAGGLLPERNDTWELVFDRDWSSGWHTTAGWFRYDVDRLVTLVPDPATGFSSFRNLGGMRVHGLEGELRGRLGPASGGLSYTWQSARDDRTGEEPPNVARHVVKGDLVAPLGPAGALLGTSVEYLGARGTLSGAESGDVLLWHANLSAILVRDHLGVSFGVRNLLDFDYGDPGTIDHRQDVIPQNGRTCRFRLTFTP